MFAVPSKLYCPVDSIKDSESLIAFVGQQDGVGHRIPGLSVGIWILLQDGWICSNGDEIEVVSAEQLAKPRFCLLDVH